MGTRDLRPKYSIVVPFHDEQESVRDLHARLAGVMTGRFEPVEFVYVDDQSSDATPQILNEIALDDSRVTVVRLKRNYGQTTALAAGFDYASGEIIISMDGDLQHDPDDIPVMLETFESTGSDIVSGWRQKRVDNFIMRRLPSRVANWMMAKLSGVDIHDFGTTFKVYRREIIKDIRLYGEMHRFIPALAALNGAKIVEVPIKNIVRPGGKSHYGISRTLRVFFDLLTIRFLLRYMTRPSPLFRSSRIARHDHGWRNPFSPVCKKGLVRYFDFRAARPLAHSRHDAFSVRRAIARDGSGRRTPDAHSFRIPRRAHVPRRARNGCLCASGIGRRLVDNPLAARRAGQ